jgi:hypothetical protein
MLPSADEKRAEIHARFDRLEALLKAGFAEQAGRIERKLDAILANMPDHRSR